MINFFLEVLDFKYPKNELYEYQKSITDWKPNIHYAKKGVDTITDAKWFDYYPNQETDLLIKEVTKNININLKPGAYKFVKTLAGGSLPFHIDPNRECVFMLPLTDNNAGLQWVDNNKNILCELIYRGPTVINAKILHGVSLNNKDRSFLQINLPCTWKHLIENKDKIFIS
jgi:hypothetical protein